MGTSATIKFITVNSKGVKVYIVIYQQYDGGPENLGANLVKFVKSKSMVNGYTYSERDKQFNGFGCMIAQYIASIKDGAGNVYVAPIDRKQNALYNYVLSYNEDDKIFTIGCDAIKDGQMIPIDKFEEAVDELYESLDN